MSRIRRNLEYYRLPTAVEADGEAAPENEYVDFNVVNQEAGVNLDQHVGVSAYEGYQRWPNGLQMAWGRSAVFQNNEAGTGTYFTVTITFSYPFDTCYNVNVTLVSDAGDITDIVETMYGVQSFNATTCVVKCSRIIGSPDTANMRFHYQAFGTYAL